MANVYSNGFGQSPFDLILKTASKSSDIMFAQPVSGGGDTGDLISSLSGTLSSALGSLGGSGSGSELISVAGESLGRMLSLLKTGQKQPSNILANNPNLTPPKMTSKLGFGELQNYILSLDQVLKRKVATFSSPSGGAGSVFNLFASAGGGFEGLSDLASVATQIFTGGNDITGSSFVENAVQQAISDVAGLLNVPSDTSVDLSVADNAIPIVTAMSAVLASDTKSPFTIDTIAQGWQLNKAIVERNTVTETA